MTNLDKLEKIFPEVITESQDADGNLIRAVDFERLKQILSGNLAEGREAYVFNFVGKKRAELEAHKPIDKTLRPIISDSRDFDTTQNLYIEGDNLDAMKILLESYLGKVKMIYIDPPYNTGNDFIYRDDFTQDEDAYDDAAGIMDDTGNRLFANKESNGRFHSDWCAMIYSRLLLAKNFLSDDGVIFISIDDHEQANLKKICDEVFGENNFVALMPRVTKRSGKSTEIFAKNHDTLIIYAKSERCKLNPLNHDDAGFKYRDEFFDTRGLYKLNQTLDYDSLQYSAALDYPLTIDDITYYAGSSYENYRRRQTGEHNRADWAWRWSKEKFKFGLANGFIVVKKTRNGVRIYTKTYQRATIEGTSGNYFIKYSERTASISSLALTDNEFSNDNAKKYLATLFDEKIFDYPKPVSLLKFILRVATDANSIVLDFFSGSATTAHAVMELNAQDGGHRKFIMIQLPETTPDNSEAFRAGFKTICDVGKERIRRAGDKLKENSPEVDTGFRVFRVDSSNYLPLPSDINQLILMAENIKDDRTAEDLFFGELLDLGAEIHSEFATEILDGVKVLSYRGGEILGCFDRKLPAEFFRKLANRKPRKIIFRDSCFASSADKINALEYFKIFAPDTEVKVL